LTRSAYEAFGTIKGLFIIVKVGARFPRPHLFGLFSDSLPGDNLVKFLQKNEKEITDAWVINRLKNPKVRKTLFPGIYS
jgi:hypothetical protein